VNNLLFDFSSGVQGRSPGSGSGGQLKVVTSKLYAFLIIIQIHTIYEVETLIIENENYTKHNSNPQIVRQYELLSSSV